MKLHEPLQNLMRKNVGLKLLAITLAVVSILSIQQITNRKEEFEVAIQVEVPEGVAVLQKDAQVAYVTCRGSRDDLRRMDAEQLELTVQPRATGTFGREQVPIGPRNVSGAPRTVSVVSVRPGVLHLTLDREIEKEVNVAKPEVVGKPVIGRAEIEFTPQRVTVRGPQQIMDEIKILRTAPIDVEDASVSFTREVPIVKEDDSALWDITPPQITARVNIVTEAINREWEGIPIMILRNPDAELFFAPEPDTVNLNILGSARVVNRIKLEDIRIFIDCTTIKEAGTYTIPAISQIAGGGDLSTAVTPTTIAVSVLEIPDPPPAPATTNILEQAEEIETPTPGPTP